MNATGGMKLPSGNIPRLLLAYITTEAVRTQSRVPSASRSGGYSIQHTVCAEILFNLWA